MRDDVNILDFGQRRKKASRLRGAHNANVLMVLCRAPAPNDTSRRGGLRRMSHQPGGAATKDQGHGGFKYCPVHENRTNNCSILGSLAVGNSHTALGGNSTRNLMERNCRAGVQHARLEHQAQTFCKANLQPKVHVKLHRPRYCIMKRSPQLLENVQEL